MMFVPRCLTQYHTDRIYDMPNLYNTVNGAFLGNKPQYHGAYYTSKFLPLPQIEKKVDAHLYRNYFLWQFSSIS